MPSHDEIREALARLDRGYGKGGYDHAAVSPYDSQHVLDLGTIYDAYLADPPADKSACCSKP